MTEDEAYADDIAQKLSAFFISDKELKHFQCHLANGCPKCGNHPLSTKAVFFAYCDIIFQS